MKLYITLVMLTITVTHLNCQDICISSQLTVQVDKRLNGYSFGSFNATNILSCARLCFSYPLCMSFDYMESDAVEQCKLNTEDSTTVPGTDFVNLVDSVFSDLSTWPPEIAGSCGQRPCLNFEVCLPTGSTHICESAGGGCGDPGITFGVYTADYAYNTILAIGCEVGYSLTGPTEIHCQQNGIWTTLPQCIIVDCGDPAITGGTYNSASTVYGTVLTVTCDAGLTITGSSTITCQATGLWTTKPTCSGGGGGPCAALSCMIFYPNDYLSAYWNRPHLMKDSIQSVEACLQLCIDQYPTYVAINYSPTNLWCGCYGFTRQEYLDTGGTIVAGYDLYEQP